ncbi:DSBA oxidoreductase [Tritrichomonas foetus]|uniref:DSBA oxidoreductase n=1 Tax=Tritrichomonas foetus TaxID=1144522 RepID=A0A1J4KI59_9EUKA|nr:DSBA oxidoreductase [Tritrichomonas foetus]|eukprot:OHT11057.1 DSBA oxidoreductase [Tritrichomonas foetus]
MSLSVDVCVVSDFLCPWCYVGGVRLDRAIQYLKEKGIQTNVTWHAFLIEDRIPAGGMDFGKYMDRRWGAPHPYWLNDVENSAKADEMPLKWNDIAVDTFEAHCCSEYVGKHYPDKQHEFHMALLRANYEENKNISKREIIGQIASSVGLNGDEIAAQTEFKRDDIPRLCFMFPDVHSVPDVTFSSGGKKLFHYSGAQTTQWVLRQLVQNKIIQ